MLCGMLLVQPGYATHSTKYCNLYCFQFSFKVLGDYISLCWYIDTIVKRDDASYYCIFLPFSFLICIGKNRSKKCILLKKHKNSRLSRYFSERLRGRLIH